jgi:hypothetical protein
MDNRHTVFEIEGYDVVIQAKQAPGFYLANAPECREGG